MDAATRMTERTLTIPTADGLVLAATHYPAAGAARGAVVIASALGVRRRFYAAFARFLASCGYDALSFDYRGVGDSRGALDGRALRLQDWGTLDINAALGWASWELAPARLFLLGHSCGGQLPGLAAHSERLDGLVCVAATAPAARHYPAPGRYALQALWSLAIPLLAARRDYLPARAFGVSSGDFPSGVTCQWAAWARSRGYLFDPAHGLDTSRYGRLSMPLLSLGFDDDRYAPPAAVEALLAHYGAASIERRWIAARAHGPLGHFGYFREREDRRLWDDTVRWLDAVAPRATPVA